MKFFYAILFFGSASLAFSQIDSAKTETGMASFYAKKFEGRKCSSGQIFHHDSLTAAHKTLKFGTKVKVTNLKNDSIVFVTVNDRLPKKFKTQNRSHASCSQTT